MYRHIAPTLERTREFNKARFSKMLNPAKDEIDQVYNDIKGRYDKSIIIYCTGYNHM